MTATLGSKVTYPGIQEEGRVVEVRGSWGHVRWYVVVDHHTSPGRADWLPLSLLSEVRP